MLDVKFIVNNRKEVEASLGKRRKGALLPVVADIVSLDERRRTVIQSVEALKFRRNQASQEIAKRKKQGGDATTILEEMKRVADEIKGLDSELVEIEEDLRGRLLELPNMADASVPDGEESSQNPVVRTWGNPTQFAFEPKSHYEIGEKLGILDFKKAGEVSGARFVFLKGLAARLEHALTQFMLHTHLAEGYIELLPPFLVNRNALVGTGQLPKFEEDLFRIEKFDFFLIPTAEVPVTNYHRDEILEGGTLPRKYVAYTPCFRSEAGSYGKDTRGLKRQHQFDKVELVQFTSPERSFEALESLTRNAESVLQKLGLPYRVVSLCGGDLGFSSTKTYDIEVWSPFVKGYIEISSCSNFLDFQARRANIRMRNSATGKVEYVHTLNGSGLAVGRTLMAILENYQTADGSFTVPEVLKPYL